jgi:hypothetical protein
MCQALDALVLAKSGGIPIGIRMRARFKDPKILRCGEVPGVQDAELGLGGPRERPDAELELGGPRERPDADLELGGPRTGHPRGRGQTELEIGGPRRSKNNHQLQNCGPGMGRTAYRRRSL